MENGGISGELRFLFRVDVGIDLCGPPDEVPCADGGEPFLLRRRFCRLELRPSARVGTGGGGEVPTTEENEECDE